MGGAIARRPCKRLLRYDYIPVPMKLTNAFFHGP